LGEHRATRYRLLFAAPLPGYDPQSERLVTASREAMQVLLDVLGPLTPDDTSNKIAKPLGKQLDEWTRSRELGGISAALAFRSVTTWSRLHGFCSPEIEGNFASMGLDADVVFNTEVNALLTAPPRSN
jgi:hypothetical protein